MRLWSFLDTVISLVDRVSNEIAPALRFQMRGLEPISATRPNGRGPDSSLIREWIFVCTCCSLTDSHSVFAGGLRAVAVRPFNATP